MEPEQYIICGECEGRGIVDAETGAPSRSSYVSGTECAHCVGSGRQIHPEHMLMMQAHIRTLLNSEPFIAEMENGNYSGALYFLEELRDNPWE